MQIGTAEYNLSRAKAQLVMEQPFYAALLCNMPFIEKNEIKGLEVDGKSIYYNAEYVNGLTVNQLKFIQANGVMKCVFQHVTRRGARDKKKWDKSSDIVINDMLVADLVGDRHPDWEHDPIKAQQGEYTADGIYKIIMQDEDDEDDKDGDKPGCEIGDQPNPSESAEIEEQWTIRAVQAAEAAKMQGKLSVNLRRFIDDIIDPKVRWQDVLRRFVSTKTKSDRSFSRPNRRFISQGLFLPALAGEKLGLCSIAIDCSGSIGQNDIDRFTAEIKNIHKELKPSGIQLYYFDSESYRGDLILPDDEFELKPTGGGGTAISPTLRMVMQEDTVPECLIVLTDLYIPDIPNDAPEFPVLWVSTASTQAPAWGELVMID